MSRGPTWPSSRSAQKPYRSTHFYVGCYTITEVTGTPRAQNKIFTRSKSMIYQGSCHCGQIAFEAEGNLEKIVECNCSICSKRGSLHWFIPRENFHLLSPEDGMSTYTFNKHIIKHRFCPKCGCAPFSEGVAPSGNYMVAINAHSLDDVDLSAIEVGHFDGRNL